MAEPERVFDLAPSNTTALHRRANLLNMLRAGGTTRYHTHQRRMLKTQTVDQHSHRVAQIVRALMSGRPSVNLVLAALDHDLAEHWAGDLPSPSKRELGIRDAFGEYEDRIFENKFGFAPVLLTHTEGVVLKLADNLDGCLFCLDEIAMGNTMVWGVLENFRGYIREFTAANGDALDAAVDFDRELFNLMFQFIERAEQ